MANNPLASATAPSPHRRRGAGRGSQRQMLLLKEDGDSAVPSLVCADGPPGCSTRRSRGCPEQHSDPCCQHSSAQPRGKTLAQRRAQLPRQLCCPKVLCDTSLMPIPSPGTFSGGLTPSMGDCQGPRLTEAVGTQAEQRHSRLAARPCPACGSTSSLSHHRTQHPSTKIHSAALLDEDKGLKCRPPPPRWSGRRMSNDISQS